MSEEANIWPRACQITRPHVSVLGKSGNVGGELLEQKDGAGRLPITRKLVFKVMGAAGANFMVMLAAAEQVDQYLPGPVQAWFIIGPLVSGWWAYEALR